MSLGRGGAALPFMEEGEEEETIFYIERYRPAYRFQFFSGF